MDPDKALADAKAALRDYRESQDTNDEIGMAEAAEEIADAFEALDGWMSKGGFPPRAWAQRAL